MVREQKPCSGGIDLPSSDGRLLEKQQIIWKNDGMEWHQGDGERKKWGENNVIEEHGNEGKTCCRNKMKLWSYVIKERRYMA